MVDLHFFTALCILCTVFPMFRSVASTKKQYKIGTQFVLYCQMLFDQAYNGQNATLRMRNSILSPVIRGGSRMVGALRQTTWCGPLRRIA